MIQRLPKKSVEDMVALQKVVNNMIENEFVAAEVYDRKQTHQGAAIRKNNKKVKAMLEKIQHQFSLDKDPHYQKFYIDEVMYIQILVPLWYENRVHGYFEGVYKVDPVVVDEIVSEGVQNSVSKF